MQVLTLAASDDRSLTGSLLDDSEAPDAIGSCSGLLLLAEGTTQLTDESDYGLAGIASGLLQRRLVALAFRFRRLSLPGYSRAHSLFCGQDDERVLLDGQPEACIVISDERHRGSMNASLLLPRVTPCGGVPPSTPRSTMGGENRTLRRRRC
jgi:hypothetical protein